MNHPVGSRVYVPPSESSQGLPCRTGKVVRTAHHDGRFVLHDNGSELGWSSHNELVTITRAPFWWRFFGRVIGIALRLYYWILSQ